MTILSGKHSLTQSEASKELVKNSKILTQLRHRAGFDVDLTNRSSLGKQFPRTISPPITTDDII